MSLQNKIVTWKKSAARERLLETASTLFSKRAYTEVGVDEIIKKAGVAKATFYSNFPSKDLLVEAWLQKIHDDSVQHQLEILDSTKPTIQKIADSFDNLKEHLENNDYRGCPYSNSCAVTDPECLLIRDQIETHKKAGRTFYYHLTQSELSEDPKTARRLADQIFLLYSGAATEAQNFRSVWPVEMAKETTLFICEQVFP